MSVKKSNLQLKDFKIGDLIYYSHSDREQTRYGVIMFKLDDYDQSGLWCNWDNNRNDAIEIYSKRFNKLKDKDFNNNTIRYKYLNGWMPPFQCFLDKNQNYRITR